MNAHEFEGKTVSKVEMSDDNEHLRISFTDNTELIVVKATEDEEFCSHSNFLAIVQVPKCPFGDHPAYMRKKDGWKTLKCDNCGSFLPNSLIRK